MILYRLLTERECEMILESKIKLAALLVAVNISFKRIKKCPERCARNLMEIGINTFPNKITKKQYDNFSQKLILLCKNNDAQGARELFIQIFFQE